MNYVHLFSPHTKGKRDKAMPYVSLGTSDLANFDSRSTFLFILSRWQQSRATENEWQFNCNLLAMEIPASQYTPKLTFQLYYPQHKSVTVNGVTTLSSDHLTQDKYSRGGQSCVDGTEINKRMQCKVINLSLVLTHEDWGNKVLTFTDSMLGYLMTSF